MPIRCCANTSPGNSARSSPRPGAPRTGGSTNTSARPRRKATSPRSKTSNRSTRPWPTAARRGCSRRRVTRFIIGRILRGTEGWLLQHEETRRVRFRLGSCRLLLRPALEAGLARAHGSQPKPGCLAIAAFSLRALGRLTEALEPMRARPGDEHHAKRTGRTPPSAASNLSELELTLGEVAGAMGDAEQSVTYADRSGSVRQIVMISKAAHADALHQAGRRVEAEARFREAEQMQAENQPETPNAIFSVRFSLLRHVAGRGRTGRLAAAIGAAGAAIGWRSRHVPDTAAPASSLATPFKMTPPTIPSE